MVDLPVDVSRRSAGHLTPGCQARSGPEASKGGERSLLPSCCCCVSKEVLVSVLAPTEIYEISGGTLAPCPPLASECGLAARKFALR